MMNVCIMAIAVTIHVDDGGLVFLLFWLCVTGSEEYVSGRMDTWDKDMKWVMDNIKLHLSHQQPNSKYAFMSSGSGNEKKVLSPLSTCFLKTP